MFQLPLWVLPFSKMAFNDAESSTAIEMTAKLYNSMKEFVSEYNRFAENTNKLIADFQTGTDKDIELFKVGIRQEFQDFIDVIELKYQSQDLELAEAVNFMKQNLSQYVLKHIDEMRADGELADVVTEAFADKLQEVTVKYEEALEELDETIQALKNADMQNRELIKNSLAELRFNDTQNTASIERLAKQIDDKKTQLQEYFNQVNEDLISRLDNLLGAVKVGSTSMDAEIIDARKGFDGIIYPTLGTSIREQIRKAVIESGNNSDLAQSIATNLKHINNIAPEISLDDATIGYISHDLFNNKVLFKVNPENYSYSYKEFDVLKNERFYIAGYQGDTCIYIFADDDLNVIDSKLMTSLRLQEYVLTVPEGATKLYFCFDNTMDAEVRKLPLSDTDMILEFKSTLEGFETRTGELEDRTETLEIKVAVLESENPSDDTLNLKVVENTNNINMLKSKTIASPFKRTLKGYYNAFSFGQSTGLVFENSEVFTTYEIDVKEKERFYLRGVGEYALDNPVFYIVFDKDNNVVQWEQYSDVNLSMGSVVNIQPGGVVLAFGTKSDEEHVIEKLPIVDASDNVDFSEYVKNTDYASEQKGGVVKYSLGYGIGVNTSGAMYIKHAENTNIDAKSSAHLPITPKNVDYAVMKALTDCINHTWTDEEKSSALSFLGGLKRIVQASGTKLYGENTSGVYMYDLTTVATNFSVAQRGLNGVLEVATPTEGTHATTKAYVDGLIAELQAQIDELKGGAS